MSVLASGPPSCADGYNSKFDLGTLAVRIHTVKYSKSIAISTLDRFVLVYRIQSLSCSDHSTPLNMILLIARVRSQIDLCTVADSGSYIVLPALGWRRHAGFPLNQ